MSDDDCDAGCHTGRITATYRHVTVVREFTRGKPPIARFACPLPQNVLSREMDFVVGTPQESLGILARFLW